MAARTVPTMPAWTAGQRVLASQLQQITTYTQFWADPPMFRMRQTIAQSIPNGAWTQVTCDASDYDSDSGRAVGTPWSYTIPAGMSGRWEFKWITPWAFNGTGQRGTSLYRNGTAITTYTSSPSYSATLAGGIWASDRIAVNAGDVMSMWVFQNSGGALNTSVASPDAQPIFEGCLASLASP